MVQLVDYTEPAVICVQLSKKLFENPLGRHAVRERERERGVQKMEDEESACSLSTRYLYLLNCLLVAIT